MAKEIKITVAFVNSNLTDQVSNILALRYGGYTKTEGFGGYTMEDGTLVEEHCVIWTVATSDLIFTLVDDVSGIARLYCREGEQESIMYTNTRGEVYFVFGDGDHREV